MTTENTENTERENDLQCELAAWELLREAKRELAEAREAFIIATDQMVQSQCKLRNALSERDEAMAIGQELADISAHCLGWHIDVVQNFKSDHTLALSRKITDTLQRWAKLKEVAK
jgi:hypothetical protein